MTTFRGMPTANIEGLIESEGSVRKVSVRRVFRHPPIDMGPRRLPSACAKMFKKNRHSAARLVDAENKHVSRVQAHRLHDICRSVDLLLATFGGIPTANAEGLDRIGG